MSRVVGRSIVASGLVGIALAGCSSADKTNPMAQASQARKGPSTLIEEEITLTPRKKEKPSAQMLVDFGNFEIAIKNYDKARRLFEDALKRNKSFGPAFAGLARVQFEQDQPSKGMEILQKGLKKAPKSPEIWNEIGVAKAKTGDYPGGIAAMETALKHSPEHPGVIENLGGMLAMTGDYQRSFELYARVMPRPEARYRTALVRDSRGDRSGAIADLQLALQTEAGYQPAAEMLARLGNTDPGVQPASFTTERRQ